MLELNPKDTEDVKENSLEIWPVFRHTKEQFSECSECSHNLRWQSWGWEKQRRKGRNALWEDRSRESLQATLQWHWLALGNKTASFKSRDTIWFSFEDYFGISPENSNDGSSGSETEAIGTIPRTQVLGAMIVEVVIRQPILLVVFEIGLTV